MTLATIAATLRAQASAGGVITIDDALLGSRTAFAAFAIAHLRRPAGNVRLTATPDAIPIDPTGTSFTFQAGAPTTDSFLGLSGNEVRATISVAAASFSLELVVSLTTRHGGGTTAWLFSQTYPELLGWPFDKLPLNEPVLTATFVPTEATGGTTGVSFTAAVAMTGVLAPIVDLLQSLGHVATPQPLQGALVPSAAGITFNLQGGLGIAQLDMSALVVDTPRIGASMTWRRVAGTSDAYEPDGQVVLVATTTLRGSDGEDLAIDVSVPMPIVGPSSVLTMTLVPATSLATSFDKLGSFMAGKSWDRFFDSEPASRLEPVLATFGLRAYSLMLSTAPFSVMSSTLTVGTLAPFELLTSTRGKVVLPEFHVTWMLIDPFGLAHSTIAIGCEVDIVSTALTNTTAADDPVLTFSGNLELPALRVSVGLDNPARLTAAQWAEQIVAIFGARPLSTSVLDVLARVALDSIALTVDTTAEALTFALNGTLTVGTHPVTFAVAIDVALLPSVSYDVKVAFGLAAAVMEGEIRDADGKTIITADWHDDVNYLQLEHIATGLGFSSLGIPPDLDIAIKQIAVAFDLTDDVFTIAAASANYGKADLVVFKPTGADGFAMFAGLAVDVPIDLTNLPLVGGALSTFGTVAIQSLQVQVTSAVIGSGQAAQLDAIVARLGTGYPVVPAAGMAATVNLSMDMNLGGFILPVSAGVGGKSATGDAANKSSVVGQARGDLGATVPTTPGANSDGTLWLNVQKAIGPLTFRRIGVRYSDAVLWFVLDAAFSAGGLAIELIGMSVGTPLSSFTPTFSLAGLGIDLSASGLELSGTLLEMPPTADITWEYGGGATMRLGRFGIAALGDYAQVGDTPSMFVFGQVSGSFGGPPAAFVTGLAGGLGYNTRLRLPGPQELSQFPLVAGAADPSRIGGAGALPTQVLTSLLRPAGTVPWLTHEIGAYWFAVGLQFTSFEIVTTNALLIVQFGNHLQFAMLGVSRARFPMSGPVTYASLELQIETIVDPDVGVFSVTAVVSPNSFLLDPTCQLTGGFAFATWFAPNTHAGDFVLSIGGYHPSFDPPDWYPSVARVGFSWALDATISITGTAYLAMTPAAAMAGAALSATYQSGRLRAWFQAWANMLVYWNPFHFDVDIGIIVGASYQLDLLLTTKAVSAEIGAQLHLYGPPTGGSVTVHWLVISFTIEFGARPSPPSEIQWAEFLKQLPKAADIVKLAAGAGLAPSGSTDMSSAEGWILRPSGFSFTSNSAIPNSSLRRGAITVADGPLINIRPLQRQWDTGAAPGPGLDLESIQTIAIDHQGTPVDLGTGWTLTPRRQNLPKAMWGVGPQDQMEPGDAQLVLQQLVGFDVVSPPEVLGPTPGVIDTNTNLSYLVLPATLELPIRPGTAPAGPVAQKSDDTIHLIGTTIATAAATQRRADLFASLGRLGVQAGANDDMTEYAKVAGAIFSDEPLLIPAAA